ncbi:MAG: DUF4230 domain-containing protein [Planctomycetota bacterium]
MPAPDSPNTDATTAPRTDSWARTVRWIFVSLIVVVGLVVLLAVLVPAWLAYMRAGDLLNAFTTTQVQTRLISHVDRTLGTSRMQLVEHHTVEEITRTSQRRLFNRVDLPEIVTSVRVPTTYVYTTDLGELHAIDYDDETGRLRIVLDDLEPGRPAPDVSAMAFRQEGSWLRFSEDDELDALKASLTELLNDRARQHTGGVRAEAREQAERFFVGFFDQHGESLGTPEVSDVDVVFADELEPRPDVNPDPTLGLDPAD